MGVENSGQLIKVAPKFRMAVNSELMGHGRKRSLYNVEQMLLNNVLDKVWQKATGCKDGYPYLFERHVGRREREGNAVPLHAIKARRDSRSSL